MPLYFISAVRAPLYSTTIVYREPRPARHCRVMADFGRFPCQGSRPWNSTIELLSASTAVLNLFSRQASRSSSTTNNLRTTPSIANNAKRSAPEEASACAPRRGLPARSAAQRRQFPSSRRRAGLCFAGRASRGRQVSIGNQGTRRPHRKLRQRRIEEQVAPKI